MLVVRVSVSTFYKQYEYPQQETPGSFDGVTMGYSMSHTEKHSFIMFPMPRAYFIMFPMPHAYLILYYVSHASCILYTAYFNFNP